MFSLNKPMMAHDWPVTVFPNMDSISRRCSYWKFRIFIYKTYKTYKTNILKLNLLSSSKLPEVRIKTALTQRCHKITQRCQWHRRPWYRGGNDTAEFFFTYANNSSEFLHQLNNGSKWVRIVDKTRGKTCHDTVPFRTIQSWLVSSKILFWHAWVGNNIQHCGMPITPLPPPPPPRSYVEEFNNYELLY